MQEARLGVGNGTEHILRPLENSSSQALEGLRVFVARPILRELVVGAFKLRQKSVLHHEGREISFPRIDLWWQSQVIVHGKPVTCASVRIVFVVGGGGGMANISLKNSRNVSLVLD